jgi:hypothetical protein
MGTMSKASFDSPEESRTFDNGKFDVVKLGGASVGRSIFEPGWRWSTSVKPIAKTDSCQTHHVGYVVSGRVTVQSNEGDKLELGPGDAYDIQPGHDAWVEGDENYVALEFRSAEGYAKG